MLESIGLVDALLLAFGLPFCLAICYLARLTPAEEARRGEDTWGHLLMADEIRKTKRLPTMDYFIFKGPSDYPPFMHLFLALLPKEWLERNWPLISPWLDTVHAGLLFFVTVLITDSVPFGLLAVVAYTLVAAMLADTLSLNARVFGSLLLTVSFASLLWFTWYGNIGVLLFSIAMGVAIVYTHKFTAQTLVFLLLGFAVLEGEVGYLYVLVAIYLLAFAVHPSLFLNIVRGHYKIISFWTTHIRHYHTREGMYDLFTKRDWKNRELWVRTAKDFSKIFYLNPFMWFVFLVYQFAEPTPVMTSLLYWCGIVFTAFLLVTYIPALQGFGNGERYMEYGIFPSVLLSVLLIRQIGNEVTYSLLSACLLLSMLASYLTIRWYLTADSAMSNLQEKLAPLFEHITKSGKDNVMCIPYSLCFITAYFTRKHVLFHISPQGFEEGLCIFPKLRDTYEAVIKRYNITFVLTDSEAFWANEFHWVEGLHEVLNAEGFHLFEVGGNG